MEKMTTLATVKERVEKYQEGSEISDLIRLIYPRCSDEQVNSMNDLSFTEFVNMKTVDFEEKGFSKNTSEKLEKTVFLFRKLRKNDSDSITTIKSPGDAAKIFNFLEGCQQENFWVCYLNVKNQVIKKEVIFIGTLNSSIVHPREIFRQGVKVSAASIVVCHNHPSGNPTPSQEDIEVTKRLKEAGQIMGIELLDHIIIGRGSYISLKEKGYF
jgi:DNA repair protein RadC